MKKFFLLVCAILITGSCYNAFAAATAMSIHIRCRAAGANYTCFEPGIMCFNPYPGTSCSGHRPVAGGLQLGYSTDYDYGNLDVDIVNGQVHLMFHNSIPTGGGDSSFLPVDTNFVQGTVISNALGYDQVILVQGNYPIDYSHNPYGEVTIDAILIGSHPIPVASEWGLIALALLLMGTALWVLRKRRGQVTA